MQCAKASRAAPAHKHQHVTGKSQRFHFQRERPPSAADYFQAQGLKLTGGGARKSAICPFHNDTKPSLRVRRDTGGFRRMVCGADGGDVLAFHMQRHGLRFIEAAKALAWKGEL